MQLLLLNCAYCAEHAGRNHLHLAAGLDAANQKRPWGNRGQQPHQFWGQQACGSLRLNRTIDVNRRKQYQKGDLSCRQLLQEPLRQPRLFSWRRHTARPADPVHFLERKISPGPALLAKLAKLNITQTVACPRSPQHRIVGRRPGRLTTWMPANTTNKSKT